MLAAYIRAGFGGDRTCTACAGTCSDEVAVTGLTPFIRRKQDIADDCEAI